VKTFKNRIAIHKTSRSR